MFWRYNLITGSCIENLLDKENVTLKELMDEEDILQECKAQAKKLLDFLVQPQILNEMVTLITEEPSEEDDEKLRYRYSNRACELLTFDIVQINDALASDEAVLEKLYNFLKAEKPLNPLLASFFSKTMGLLISKKTESIFKFLKDTNFISLVLNHLDTSAVMDLLLRFVTSIENNEMRSMVIKWLDEQKLIQQLVSRIDIDYDEDINCNASYAVRHIIKSSREHMSLLQEKAEPNPLLEAIESVEVVSELLNLMFKDVTKECAIVNGILVLLELLMFKKQGPAGVQQMPSQPSDQPLQADNAPSCYMSLFRSMESEQMTALDAERLSQGVNNVLTAVTPRLDDFHNLLLKPPVKPAITLTIGRLDPPLGNCRLEVAHLLTALLSTNNHLVNVKLASLETIIVLMDMFFEYSWNNFLHTYVEHAIGRIVSNSPTTDNEGNKVHPLLDQLLTQYKITIKILEKYEEKPDKPAKKGYMGHLTKIANRIAQNAEGRVNSSLITEKLKELSEDHQKQWDVFVNVTLADINKRNMTQPPTCPSLSNTSIEDSPFGKDASIHLAFSDYHMQEMTSNFVDQFGFDDDEFGDTDESSFYGRNALNPLSQNFPLSDGNTVRSAELFEEVCHVKINPDGDAVLWADRGDNSPTFSTCFRMSKPTDENSSDSDEECQVFEPEGSSLVLTTEEIKMDVDNHEAGIFDGVPMDVVPATLHNPWESSETSSATSDDQGNWADFSNFAAFGASTSENPGVIGSTVSVAMETSDGPSFLKCASSSETASDSNATDDVSKETGEKEKPPPEKQKIMSGLFDEETCSATVHNGPV